MIFGVIKRMYHVWEGVFSKNTFPKHEIFVQKPASPRYGIHYGFPYYKLSSPQKKLTHRLGEDPGSFATWSLGTVKSAQ